MRYYTQTSMLSQFQVDWYSLHCCGQLCFPAPPCPLCLPNFLGHVHRGDLVAVSGRPAYNSCLGLPKLLIYSQGSTAMSYAVRLLY